MTQFGTCSRELAKRFAKQKLICETKTDTCLPRGSKTILEIITNNFPGRPSFSLDRCGASGNSALLLLLPLPGVNAAHCWLFLMLSSGRAAALPHAEHKQPSSPIRPAWCYRSLTVSECSILFKGATILTDQLLMASFELGRCAALCNGAHLAMLNEVHGT